jgi:hypothetical protein
LIEFAPFEGDEVDIGFVVVVVVVEEGGGGGGAVDIIGDSSGWVGEEAAGEGTRNVKS